MSQWIRLGRRKDDTVIMFGWRKERGMVEADTAFILNAIDLDIIPPGPNGRARGMILTDARWGSRLYLVMIRSGWTEDQYFDYAEQRFRDLGIKVP